jgi:hypothetical protein
MHRHRVQQGECLTSLATRYRLKDWRELYHHPDNDSLRELLRDPHALLPGDVVAIPDREERAVECATGRLHRFLVRRRTVEFRVRLVDGAGTPHAGKRFALRVDDHEIEQRTDADGFVDASVPPEATSAHLRVWFDDEDDEPDLDYEIAIGHLDPVETITGVQARLDNLGFACEVTGRLDEATLWAMRAFRAHHGLPGGGDEPDDALRAKLRAEHDNP